MAGDPKIMAKIIVLDSSFLIELFALPGDSTAEKHQAAASLFKQAINNSYDIFCPLSVLYEVANHIADIKNAKAQMEIAKKFKETVISAHQEGVPFAVIPNGKTGDNFKELAELPSLCAEYQEHLRQGLGLTDCTIIDVAKAIKANYHHRQKNWNAHIWTLHKALKALEPDRFEHKYF
ncbi:type II toxin-antitoxin system VapC family toxin [Pseudomonas aeruginosa]|uniref:type II toxin-antitoxin system VapC family toxin n=1 Tax=Pseudomonas aeruginosa TaxID=287 RepID=UPI0011450FF4|nr:type II toxin-antitoxin system VapC family toxin [Pseudomonas aeruginosa]